MSGGLAVTVDGVAMPEEEARALWARFSAWMEEHRGDLAGFAAREGFASVVPAVEGGRPVLRASRTEAQRPYTAARADQRPTGKDSGRGGSPPRHRSGQEARGRALDSPKARRKAPR